VKFLRILEPLPSESSIPSILLFLWNDLEHDGIKTLQSSRRIFSTQESGSADEEFLLARKPKPPLDKGQIWVSPYN
jgi:hypothetical protein